MSMVRKEVRLIVDERAMQEPLLWRMSRAVPAVVFDIREAVVRGKGGTLAIELEGEEDDILDAMDYLTAHGAAVLHTSRDSLDGVLATVRRPEQSACCPR